MSIFDLASEDAMFRTIEKHFKESLSALAQDHSEWREYDDFYLAKQWNAQRASWRPDPVVNYVSYIVDQKSPQLTNNRPTGLILPRGEGDEDAARLFTSATEIVAERTSFDDKVTDIVPTGLLLGTSWLYVYWDNSVSGGSKAKGNIWVGDVAIDCPDPANIYHDPQANEVGDCRYMIYAVPKTTQWVYENFKVRVNAEQSFITEIYNRSGKEQAEERVMFYAYWYRIDGTINVIYAAGGKILKHLKRVYRHGRYPFIPFRPKKKRKSILGISEVRNIIDNQKLLNKLIEMPTTHALLTSNPIVLIDPNSGIDKNKWVNKGGQIWYAKNPTQAVHWLTPPSMGQDAYKLTDMLTAYIEKIGGVYDSVTGQTPKGVTAAAAIQMLMEQGSMPIKGIAKNLYSTIRDVYELMIELIKENYTETRYLRIEDEGQYKFVEFDAAKYAEIDFDIKVSAGASTPTSKAYIAQLASDLFDKGVLLPSEYVEMQEVLPNKDKIVARLREIESQQQSPQQQSLEQPQQEGMASDFETIYAEAPDKLKQEIDLMLEQGMTEDQVLETLMQLA